MRVTDTSDLWWKSAVIYCLDTEPPDTSDQVVFPDQEDSIWEKDDRTGEW